MYVLKSTYWSSFLDCPCFLAVWFWTQLSLSFGWKILIVPTSQKVKNWIKTTIYVKHLELCLAYSKCSVSVNYFYSSHPKLQAGRTMVSNCQCFLPSFLPFSFFPSRYRTTQSLSNALHCQNSQNYRYFYYLM